MIMKRGKPILPDRVSVKRQFLISSVQLTFLVFLAAAAMAPLASNAGWVEYRILIDDCNRPLPGEPPTGWFYNCMGGDRGLIRDINDTNGTGVASYSKTNGTTYRGLLQRTIGSDLWEFFGFWQALGRPNSQKNQWNPAAVFHPLVRPEYQGQLVGADALVSRIVSPSGYSSLTLKLELKGYNNVGNEVVRASTNFVGRSTLTNGSFPRVFSLNVNPTNVGSVGLFNVILDVALPGDALDVDDLYLRVRVPELPPNIEPLLFSLAMLLNNYDDMTGMVQDRSNFPNGDFENVTATAKLAKLLALGVQNNLIEYSGGRTAVVQIATTLLTRVPRGPAGLWPHFTKSGGTIRVNDTEWASGDTAYAILDLMVALQLIGDPVGQLPACQSFLNAINWAALYRPGQGYSHGFDSASQPLSGTWKGFGIETLGVQLAALAGGGPMGIMNPPPTDNGSGFILHAAYPIVPNGVDRWGNDWTTLRQTELAQQLAWYANPAHENPFLATNGLFGLSAAECPAGWDTNSAAIYQAYGMGGRYSGPNDGAHKIVAPHYLGMVSALAPAASSNMWARLKSMGLVSPMNMVESLAINRQTGAIETVNFLKGSWNLGLFCEGWFMAQPGVSESLQQAVAAVPALSSAWNQLFPTMKQAPVWNHLNGLPSSTCDLVFAVAGGTLMVASTAPDAPKLWVADIGSTMSVFRELSFDTNMLQSSWYWSKQITSLAVLWTNGVPHFYAGTSGGIMEVNPNPGVGNALTVFWSWPWDTSAGLRQASNSLVWHVWNCGAESGEHTWSPGTGFSTLHWSVEATETNRIWSSASGAMYGWCDMRGYIWSGTNPPPVLLSSSGYSTNGGATWTAYVSTSGSAIAARNAEVYGQTILLVGLSDWGLYLGGFGQPFRALNCPATYPSSMFLDGETGLTIAGTGSALYYAWLPEYSSVGLMTGVRPEGSSIRLSFAGRPGTVYRIEYTGDFTHWTPLSTNTLPPSSSFEVIDTMISTAPTRFYRAVLLQPIP
jgi:hypothetical protein